MVRFSLNLVRNRVKKLKKLNRFRYSSKKSILNKPEIRNYLQELHDRYVFVPTDKASNNIAVICKYYYIKVLLKEIGLFDNKQKSAYINVRNFTGYNYATREEHGRSETEY